MSLIRVASFFALVVAKSALASPHSHSALYKRGAQPLGTLGVALVATIGTLLGVVLLVYLVMHVPSWYCNWRERRRTAKITNGLPALQQSPSVNASVTVMGGSDVASTITKFGRTPLGGTPTFITPILSRAATRDTHTQPQLSPWTSPITPSPLLTSGFAEAQTINIPSIAVTPSSPYDRVGDTLSLVS